MRNPSPLGPGPLRVVQGGASSTSSVNASGSAAVGPSRANWARGASDRRARARSRCAEMSRPDETAPDEAPLFVHDLRIDFLKRTVRVRGEEAPLTFVEFEIVSALARAPGRVFTRDMLLARIWGDSAYRDPRTIDVHIRHLREKIERDPKDPEYLFTVRGVGYRFRDTDPYVP